MFFVSVASKGLTYCTSLLFATHTRGLISVASKGLTLPGVVYSRKGGCAADACDESLPVRLLRRPDAGVPLHASHDSALRFENLGAAAGSHRYSHRGARREIQGAASPVFSGGFCFRQAARDRRAG